MTTQAVLTQPHTEDYFRIEPLPDPPRESAERSADEAEARIAAKEAELRRLRGE